MRDKVLVFGGTTEGRELAALLREAGIPHVVSVATEYGLQILKESGEQEAVAGRKDSEEIARFIEEGGFATVVDSTHPFATTVSEEIKKACDLTGTEYIRIRRDTGSECGSDFYENAIYSDSLSEAVAELEKINGNILLLTGSRDLMQITQGIGDISRIYVRVLPDMDSLKKCIDAGLTGKQIIAMQGPFSCNMNEALISEVDASVILTKESGRQGGFPAKMQAAKNCGIKAVVLRNPENGKAGEVAYTVRQACEYLKKGADQDRKTIVLAGIGPGDEALYTKKLSDALGQADVIFGASSVIEDVTCGSTPKVPMYKAQDIISFLSNNPQYNSPVILFSGDISLSSGYKNARILLEEAGYSVTSVPGISSVSLFLQRLGIGLEDTAVLSAHGRSCNVMGHVLANRDLIVLPSDCSHAEALCNQVADVAGHIVIGYELGNRDELVFDYPDSDRHLSELTGRCLIYIHRKEGAGSAVFSGVRDADIIRGNVPMTKEEIRALSIRKLALSDNAVLYDVGAGTGSVSIEACLLHPDIRVYAVEKNVEALDLLEKNRKKFSTENLEIVPGNAPKALLELPKPTHAFIGGSGGHLGEILDAIYEKNEQTRVVINCVTAETFSETLDYIKEHGDIVVDMIQVSVTRYKEVGRYHMADAVNPVYIITLRKEKGE